MYSINRWLADGYVHCMECHRDDGGRRPSGDISIPVVDMKRETRPQQIDGRDPVDAERITGSTDHNPTDSLYRAR